MQKVKSSMLADGRSRSFNIAFFIGNVLKKSPLVFRILKKINSDWKEKTFSLLVLCINRRAMRSGEDIRIK